MAETISWSVALDVSGGPSATVSPSVSVDGYDSVEISVADTATETVGVIPASSTAMVLMIVASRYDDADLIYSLGTAVDVPLDGPQLFTGSMVAAAFGADPDELSVTNSMGEEVTVSVLTGRNG